MIERDERYFSQKLDEDEVLKQVFMQLGAMSVDRNKDAESWDSEFQSK